MCKVKKKPKKIVTKRDRDWTKRRIEEQSIDKNK